MTAAPQGVGPGDGPDSAPLCSSRPRKGHSPGIAPGISAPVEIGELRPSPRGGLLLYGSRPGQIKGAGRPSNAFRQLMRELVDQPETWELLSKILRGESFTFKGAQCLVDGRLFLDTHRYVTERAYGRVASEATSPDRKKTLLIRFVREGQPA